MQHASAETGADLYAAHCVRCHGPAGQGTAEYETPLEGDLSALQLAEQIRLTMPADDPESLSEEQAHEIAVHIHGEFYSPIARARRELPAIELARLTVDQYRQTTADLVGHFRPAVSCSEAGGVVVEYYDGRLPKDGPPRRLAASSTDSTIDVRYGSEAPVPQLKDPYKYAARWQGSLIACETGWYDIVVRTNLGFRLWLNDPDTKLMDEIIQSGEETEFAAKVLLVGGRAYPFRLEVSRGLQGVMDKKLLEANKKSAEAFVQLLWAPPQRGLEVIPARYLSPESVPASYICRTPFPPDDRSYGWERGTSTSQAWFDAVTAGAIETATYVVDNFQELAAARMDLAGQRDACRDFCRKFAEYALRQPLTDDLQQLYVDRHFEGDVTTEDAVKRSLLLVLTSPRFLFREVGSAPTDADNAARLAFTLWDSLPDDPLRRAAAQGQLRSQRQLRDQAVRMIDDDRARWKLRQFLFTWLQVRGEAELYKDPERFPTFDTQVASDLRASLDLFLQGVVWSPESDYRQLFLADQVFLNSRLAEFYQTEDPVEGDFAPVRLDDGRRAGVITHPYVLSNFAYQDTTSPIHRGVFLVRGVLGQSLNPPPEAVSPLAADLHPGLTTRQRVELQTKPAVCMTCHQRINPLGFALERFDAVGRYRETDGDKPVDDTARYQPVDGPLVTFAGARELAEFLAESDEVSRAFTEQMFRFLVQQSVEAHGPEVADALHQSFVDSGYSIRELAVEIAVVASLFDRQDDVASQGVE